MRIKEIAQIYNLSITRINKMNNKRNTAKEKKKRNKGFPYKIGGSKRITKEEKKHE